MKKPLAIAIIIASFAVSASLFATAASNSAVIAKMKAGNHAFTLAADLNAGETGLTSAPLEGKKTGDILTAAEYNRLLEVVSESGEGGGGDGGWEDVSLSNTEAFDGSCEYRVKKQNSSGGAESGYHYSFTVSTSRLWFDSSTAS